MCAFVKNDYGWNANTTKGAFFKVSNTTKDIVLG